MKGRIYFVHTNWWVELDGEVYGPFDTSAEAYQYLASLVEG